MSESKITVAWARHLAALAGRQRACAGNGGECGLLADSIDIRLCRGCGVELQHHPDLCPSNSDTRRGVWLDRQRGNTCQAGPRKGLHHQPHEPGDRYCKGCREGFDLERALYGPDR